MVHAQARREDKARELREAEAAARDSELHAASAAAAAIIARARTLLATLFLTAATTKERMGFDALEPLLEKLAAHAEAMAEKAALQRP